MACSLRPWPIRQSGRRPVQVRREVRVPACERGKVAVSFLDPLHQMRRFQRYGRGLNGGLMLPGRVRQQPARERFLNL